MAPPPLPATALLLAALAMMAAGCAANPRPSACVPPSDAFAWVVQRAWHTEIGLPPAALTGHLASLRASHPGAVVFLFGFGKRSWMEAQEGDVLAILTGPLPGEGLMQVTALTVHPEAAFGAGAEVVRAPLPPGGQAALAAALAASFSAGGTGTLHASGSSFFRASRGYSLAYTCNTWTADMLRQAGLPLRVEGVVGTADVMRQVNGQTVCAGS